MVSENFRGKNLKNNCWEVDFNKRNVKFWEATKKRDTEFQINNSFFLGMIMCMVSCILLAIIFASSNPILVGFCFPIGIIGGIVVKLLLQAKNPWLMEFIPKMSAWFYGEQVRYRINPKAIINNQFVLPWNTHVKFKYIATKDYAFNLKSIRMVNKFKGNDHNFVTVIEWTEKPKEGYMDIWYSG